MSSHLSLWSLTAAVTAGVLLRPFGWPEAVWAVTGGVLAVALGLLPLSDALTAVGKGTDVYLFLIGMMLLSETARRQGLFDWVASHAVRQAKGSRSRLFLLVYLVGVVVTAFLSNDAAAVVLTPAVFAAARQARAPALPYLFICAFVANAASFVLPISNPANLVLYGEHMPALWPWLLHFTLPSVLAIASTFLVLRFTQRRELAGGCEVPSRMAPLSSGGRTALAGLIATAVVLMAVSAMDWSLGLPTCVMGVLTAAVVLLRDRSSPLPLLREVSWTVLPLVAGLFVLVEAISRTGLTERLAQWLMAGAQHGERATGAIAGTLLAFGSNLVNNLPAGLLASTMVQQAHPPASIVDALLIGVDLGPNLSITGSLATILWLIAIRREGEDVGFVRFLKVGVLVMPPALCLALGARLLTA